MVSPPRQTSPLRRVAQLKSPSERLDILAAFRELGSFRAAAALCGVADKTVKRVVRRQQQGPSASTAACGSSSAIRAAPGSARRTRTPTTSSVSTSLAVTISRVITRRTSTPLRASSTVGRGAPSTGGRLPRSSLRSSRPPAEVRSSRGPIRARRVDHRSRRRPLSTLRPPPRPSHCGCEVDNRGRALSSRW